MIKYAVYFLNLLKKVPNFENDYTVANILSYFQEKAGCDEIWEKICSVQGKDPSVDFTQVSRGIYYAK